MWPFRDTPNNRRMKLIAELERHKLREDIPIEEQRKDLARWESLAHHLQQLAGQGDILNENVYSKAVFAFEFTRDVWKALKHNRLDKLPIARGKTHAREANLLVQEVIVSIAKLNEAGADTARTLVRK